MIRTFIAECYLGKWWAEGRRKIFYVVDVDFASSTIIYDSNNSKSFYCSSHKHTKSFFCRHRCRSQARVIRSFYSPAKGKGGHNAILSHDVWLSLRAGSERCVSYVGSVTEQWTGRSWKMTRVSCCCVRRSSLHAHLSPPTRLMFNFLSSPLNSKKHSRNRSIKKVYACLTFTSLFISSPVIQQSGALRSLWLSEDELCE